MWKITLRSPEGKPEVYDLKPGINLIGRLSSSDICIRDVAASRRHAELALDPSEGTLVIRDLNSKNGTYVNRRLIQGLVSLQPNDTIRIGKCVLSLTYFYTAPTPERESSSSHRHTRELLLESLDHHAILMYEAARQLNTVLDIDTALREVSSLMQRYMGADKCEVILADKFDRLRDLGFPESIAKTAIEQRSTVVIPDMSAFANQQVGQSALLFRIRSALCVPVMSGDDLLALIYMYKTEPGTRPFDQSDMQLAVGISHQAALTIQRTILLEKIRQEQEVQHLLRRFLAPQEAQTLMKDYQESGTLPGLTEEYVSVLFADIADSTGIAERIGAKDFGALLKIFYQDLTEIVFEFGGLIKLLGDGVMAIFSQSRSGVGHEERAVRAGISFIEHMASAQSSGGILERSFVIGVGVNTGVAMVGYVGSRERVEYNVLGDTVNVAARIQYFARPNRLIIGPATMAAIVGKFVTKRVGEVRVRGRERPLQIYEVLGESGPGVDQEVGPVDDQEELIIGLEGDLHDE